MVWSIFKDTSSDNADEWQPNYAAWYYDHDIDTSFPPNRIKFLHDGLHEVNYKYGVETFTNIIQVANGMFEVDTEDRILMMVDKAGYWGKYIEMFYKKNGKIFVAIGS